MSPSRSTTAAIAALATALACGCGPGPLTYHNDNGRTGWNASEGTLTPANVTPATFGLIALDTLDDQVDAQPLVIQSRRFWVFGRRSTVYVATENNTVYAIDGNSGTILKTVNLGPPVHTPLGCTNNGPNVGITGTPTIDVARKVMYVMA
jgi:outer membrane protein assembly factor BamB